MRKLKACVHIKAPVQTVQALTEPGQGQDWRGLHGSSFLRTVSETWETAEMDGGTRLTLHVEVQSRFPFLEPLVAGDFTNEVAASLTRLKYLAEERVHRAH